MSQFRIVHSAVHAAIAGLCWWVLHHLTDLEVFITGYKPIFVTYKEFAVPVLLTALAMLFRLSDRLSNALVEKIPGLSWLLRKTLSRNDFIEGDWPLVVVDMEKQTLLYLGFLHIGFRNAQTFVEGDDWHANGEHAHAFQSVQSLYRNQTLQYWYEQGASLFRPDMRGYTEIYFFPRGQLAERHAGKFLDPKHTTDIRFYAVRKRGRLSAPRLRTKTEKLEAARTVWLELEPHLALLKSRDISTDFV